MTHRDGVGDPTEGASESLADAPHRRRLASYPADRPRDLYGSLSALLGMTAICSRFDDAIRRRQAFSREIPVNNRS